MDGQSLYTTLARQKWKTANDEDALKCWNLELAIEAEKENKPVTKMLTMDDIIEE
jgi:hypothetical protein